MEGAHGVSPSGAPVVQARRPGYSSEFQAHIATTEMQLDAHAYPWPDGGAADVQTTEEAHAFVADGCL